MSLSTFCEFVCSKHGKKVDINLVLHMVITTVNITYANDVAGVWDLAVTDFTKASSVHDTNGMSNHRLKKPYKCLLSQLTKN